MSAEENVNYIVMVIGENGGLVKYRLAPAGGNPQEFHDLEQAVEFARANDVYDLDVVFPDGDVRSIPLFVRRSYEPGQQDTTRNNG